MPKGPDGGSRGGGTRERRTRSRDICDRIEHAPFTRIERGVYKLSSERGRARTMANPNSDDRTSYRKGHCGRPLIRRLRAMKAAGNIAGALAAEEVRAFLVGFGRHNPATNSDRQKKPRR